jgi:hypothetical protein
LVKDKETLKVHLWFWLTSPIYSASLKAHFKREISDGRIGEDVIDLATLNEVQQLFVSRPRFLDFDDPIPQRSDLVVKDSMSVSLNERAYAEVIAESPKRRQHRVRKPSIKARLTLPQKHTEVHYADEGARAYFKRVIQKYSDAVSNRNELIFKTALSAGGLISAGRVNEEGIIQEIIEASVVNGYYFERGEEYILQSIKNGIDSGKLNPIENRTGRIKPPELQERSTVDEINSVTEELMSLALKNGRTDSIDILRIPTGAGKTRVALDKLGTLNLEGRSVFFIAQDHHQLAEAKKTLETLHPSINPQTWESKQRQCSTYKEAKGQLLDIYDDIIEEMSYPMFCKEISCPKYKTSRCTTWMREKRDGQKRFTFTVHAMLPHLKELPDDALLVIDESPQIAHVSSQSLNLLEGLTWRASDQNADQNDYDAQFRDKHKDSLSALAPRLFDQITQCFKSLTVGKYGVIKNLKREDLIGEAKEVDQDLINLATTVLKQLEEENPLPRRIRFKDHLKAFNAGVFDQGDETSKKATISPLKASRKGITLLKHLCRLITGEEVNLSAKIEGNGSEREVTVQRRSLLEWPKAQSIVLDATADAAEWEAYAKQNGLTQKVHDIALSGGVNQGYWIQNGKFQRSALEMDENGCFSSDTMSSIGNALRTIRRHLESPERIALITSKPIYSFLNDLRDGQLDINGHQLLNDLSDLFSAGHTLDIGYVGRDHIATNQFEDCTALVLLGAQYPNLGEVKADIDFLTKGLNYTPQQKDEMYQNKADSIHIQSIGRLRGLRRSEELTYFYFAPRKAPPPQIPNLIWNHSSSIGRPRSERSLNVEREAEEVLAGGDEISIAVLRSRWEISEKMARMIFKRLVHRYPDHVERGEARGGRPPKVIKTEKCNESGGLDISALIVEGKETSDPPPVSNQSPIYILYTTLRAGSVNPPLLKGFSVKMTPISNETIQAHVNLPPSSTQTTAQTASPIRTTNHIHSTLDPHIPEVRQNYV